ncbi:MAG: hypothetical protein H0Z33_05365 [Bacillaceae bacterium]|nr:hypothetical protein [Bacillaceae bacterium]
MLEKLKKKIALLPRPLRILILVAFIVIHIAPLLFAGTFFFGEKTRPALMHFPLNPDHTFQSADTYLSVENPDEHRYTIRVDTVSQTSKKAYLRQDVTLLFQDGILIKKSYGWKENEDTLIHRVEAPARYNHLFQAISFHHAEFHDPSGVNETITSQFAMSYDYLYVAASKFGGIHQFHQPETDKQVKWKEVMDRAVQRQLQFEWDKAIEEFEIDEGNYYKIPLVQLELYGSKEELPGIPGSKQAEVIGRLWEGLYRHYVLGSDNQTETEGSSMPLILIDKQGQHLRIVYRTANGIYHQLFQEIS